MRRRLAAALLVVAAAWLWFGVAAPARRERDASRDEFARLRSERERVRAQAEAIGRRAAVGRTPEAGAAAARAMRRALLQATEGAPVGAVRIAAGSAERGRVAASGRLSVEGELEAVLDVADRLADPRSGVVVRRAVLSEAGQGNPDLRLELEAFSLKADQ